MGMYPRSRLSLQRLVKKPASKRCLWIVCPFVCLAALIICSGQGFAASKNVAGRLRCSRSSRIHPLSRKRTDTCQNSWPGVRRKDTSPVQLQSLPDAHMNLLGFFAEQLTAMPQHVTEMGSLGFCYFVAMAALGDSLTFPVTPMMVTSGYIFGLPLGALAMLMAMSCSATLHFFLARTVLRPQVEQLLDGNSKLRSVNKAVEREGFKIMFLMRLEPMLPSSLTNLAFGLSSASYSDFILATFAGYAPYTLALVSSATLFKDVLGDASDRPWYLYAAGVLMYVGLLWLIADVAGKAVDAAVREEEDDFEDLNSDVFETRMLARSMS
eukprot:TRINITY_DN64017_c0_g1_i1.p1 TRINITY_DN64017_c0_g1~~TRINITY_DN64017_c0_g1_i1.p1  ORF type:complete len:325 (+),score=38.38 TRINITY_DN64017_c0_g1_i1:48-1022(+)